MDIEKLLPFLIPLVILQFSLLGYALWHILTHDKYKKGTRMTWLIVTIIGMQFIGPILYFAIGKDE